MQNLKHQNLFLRGGSALVIASLSLPMLGCGAPAPQQTQAPSNNPQASTKMSTKQKLTLLAGAAALYYVYNRYKKQNEANLAGKNVQYYLSKNGRVYYRDPVNPQKVIWVTPAPGSQKSISIPEQEAAAYRDFSGYNGARSGKELSDVFTTR
jgi:hypothetical protein